MLKITNRYRFGKSDISKFIHAAVALLLPITLFALIRLDFLALALGLVVISKWRMFSVKARFWLINVRANSVDMLVGLSIVLFMYASGNITWQLVFLIAFIAWNALIKPGSSVVMNMLQAMIALLAALMAVFVAVGDLPLILLVSLVGLICYVTAHHFLDDFDEPFARFLAYSFAFIGSAIAWVSGHWLLYYGYIAQPMLMIVILGYGLGGLYYFDHKDKLSRIIKMEIIFIMSVVMVIGIIALMISSSSSSII